MNLSSMRQLKIVEYTGCLSILINKSSVVEIRDIIFKYLSYQSKSGVNPALKKFRILKEEIDL